MVPRVVVVCGVLAICMQSSIGNKDRVVLVVNEFFYFLALLLFYMRGRATIVTTTHCGWSYSHQYTPPQGSRDERVREVGMMVLGTTSSTRCGCGGVQEVCPYPPPPKKRKKENYVLYVFPHSFF